MSDEPTKPNKLDPSLGWKLPEYIKEILNGPNKGKSAIERIKAGPPPNTSPELPNNGGLLEEWLG